MKYIDKVFAVFPECTWHQDCSVQCDVIQHCWMTIMHKISRVRCDQLIWWTSDHVS